MGLESEEDEYVESREGSGEGEDFERVPEFSTSGGGSEAF